MAVFFSDTFTDSDGTVLSSHTPETGTGWIERDNDGSNMEIQDNELTGDGGLSDGALYTANATYPSDDYDVTGVIGTADSGDDTFHIVARWTDNNNMLALRYNEDVFALHKKVAGTWTTIANRAANVPVDGETVGIRVSGNTAKILKNGSEIATVTGLDAVLETGVAGVAIGGGAVNRVAADDVSAQTLTSFEIDNTGSATVDIIVNNASHSHSATSPTITQTQVIAVNNSSHAHSAEQPSVGALLAKAGYETIGANDELVATSSSATLGLQKLTFSDAAVIKKVYAATKYTSGISNTQARAVIYSDSGGTVTSLLHSTSFAGQAGTSYAWQEFTFTVDPDLAAGDYWIGLEGLDNSNSGTALAYDTGGPASSSYVDDLPFGSGTYGSKIYSVYVEYEASNTISINTDDASHAHSATAPSNTQTHAITTADSSHAHAATSPAVAQTNIISVDNAAHAHTADNTTADVTSSIAVDNSSHTHTATEPSNTQSHVITTNNASHAHAADNVTISQTHAIASDNSSHAHTATEPTVSQAQDIAVADSSHTHSATEATVDQSQAIEVDNAAHAHAATEPALTQSHVVAVDDSSHAHSASQPTNTQTYVISVNGATHAHTAENIDLVLNPAVIELQRRGNLDLVGVFSASGGAGTFTTVQVDAGANTVLVVAAITDDITGDHILGIDYNAVAMTRQASLDHANGDSFVDIYTLVSPATGTNNLSIRTNLTTVQNALLAWWVFDNVDQTNPVDVSNTAAANGSPSVSLTTTVDDAWIVGGYATEQDTGTKLSIDNLATANPEFVDFGGDTGGAGDFEAGSAGSKTLSWTDSDNNQNYIIAALALKPASGSQINIITADASHAHAATEPALTQTHAIAVDNATHEQTSDNTTIDVTSIISVDNAAHTHSATEPQIVEVVDIAVDDSSHNHNATEPALSQTHAVTSADASHNHSATEPTITVNAIPIEPDNATLAHTATQPAITQTHSIAVDNASHAHTAEQLTVVSIADITVNNAAHAHTAGNSSIDAITDIAVADATHNHSASEPALEIIVSVITANASHDHTAEQPLVDQAVAIEVDSATMAQIATEPTNVVLHNIAVDNATHSMASSVSNVSSSLLVDETFITLNANAVIGLALNGNTMTARVVSGTIEAQSLNGASNNAVTLSGSDNGINLIGP